VDIGGYLFGAVGEVKDGFAATGARIYAKWHEVLTRYMEGTAKQGAIWFLYYPTSCSSGIRRAGREHAAAAPPAHPTNV